MALDSATVWEVRTTGSDTNGGGFVPGSGGTDYSQQNAKNTVGSNISTTDAVANGSTTLTSATAAFTSAIVGNIIYLQGGSGSLTNVWRQVTGFTNATTITLDAAVAAGTGITMNIGGALASLGMVGFSFRPSNTIHIGNTGTYSITTASTNVSGGCFDAGSSPIFIYGYNTSRMDAPTGTNRPLLQASGITGFTLLLNSNASSQIAWLRLDGNNLTSGNGTQITGNGEFLYQIDVANCTSNGFHNFLGAVVHEQCTAHGCRTGFSGNAGTTVYLRCASYSNTSVGFVDGLYAEGCIAAGNGGSGFTSGGAFFLQHCDAYGNSSHGFLNGQLRDCISVSNTGNGYQSPVGLWNCASYNNAARRGGSLGTLGDNSPIVLTGDPFTNAAGADFSLNSTAGAGADCRAAGYPGVLPYGGTGYQDIGALQHQDAGGGTTTIEISTVQSPVFNRGGRVGY